MTENAGVDPKVVAAEREAYPPEAEDDGQDQTMLAEDPTAPEPPLPEHEH